MSKQSFTFRIEKSPERIYKNALEKNPQKLVSASFLNPGIIEPTPAGTTNKISKGEEQGS